LGTTYVTRTALALAVLRPQDQGSPSRISKVAHYECAGSLLKSLRAIELRFHMRKNSGVLLKLVVLLVVRALGGGHRERFLGRFRIQKSGADGRIRTGDPLFTKQLPARPTGRARSPVAFVPGFGIEP
jgi:hypothetical protein